MDEGEEEGGEEVERGQRSFSRFNSYDGHERTNAPTRGAALQRSDSLVSVSSDSLLPIGRRSLVVTTEDMGDLEDPAMSPPSSSDTIAPRLSDGVAKRRRGFRRMSSGDGDARDEREEGGDLETLGDDDMRHMSPTKTFKGSLLRFSDYSHEPEGGEDGAGGTGGEWMCHPCCGERGNGFLRSVRKFIRVQSTKYRNKPTFDKFAGIFPCLVWMRTYTFEFLRTDIVAGLSVGAMVVPQSMSYATIAGLPTQFGLYSALVPVLVYSIFGSSRQLAVGPVALVSLLVYSGLQGLVDFDSDGNPVDQARYNLLAIQLAFLAGLSQVVLGLIRFGFIVNFLSHAVISGFTTGAAVIIGLSQIGGILGYKIPKTSSWPGVARTLYYIFKDIDKFNYKTFLMGTGFLAILLTFKALGKRYEKLRFMRTIGPLTVAVVGIVIVWPAQLDDKGIPIVGEIPKGLPSVTFADWGRIDEFGSLMVSALSITLVGFLESIAIAKSLAARNNYEIDANQELLGLGLANFLGAGFSSYPVTGSFSRSAVSNETGAKTGLAGAVTFIVVLLTLLLLAPVLKWLPVCVLSAIVISAVIGLIDSDEAKFLWKADLRDFFIWVIALVGTLFLGVEIGLAIAVGLSLIFVVYESAYPHISVLGRLPETFVYRNIKQYPDALLIPGLLLLRIDAPIYFANVSYIKDRLRKHEKRAERTAGGIPLRFVILEMGPVTHIDSTAIHALKEIFNEYKSRDVKLLLANPSKRVLKQMNQAELLELIGNDGVFVRSHDAVLECQDTLAKEYQNGGMEHARDLAIPRDGERPADEYTHNLYAPDDNEGRKLKKGERVIDIDQV